MTAAVLWYTPEARFLEQRGDDDHLVLFASFWNASVLGPGIRSASLK